MIQNAANNANMARRKKVPRERNGRPQRQSREENRHETKRHVLETRCRHIGLDVTPENIRRADKYGGTAWGVMYLHGDLTLRQHAAAETLAIIDAGYLSAIGAPSPYPKGLDLEGGGGRSLMETPEVVDIRRRERMQEVEAALGALTNPVRRFLRMGRAQNPIVLQFALDKAADALCIEGEESA